MRISLFEFQADKGWQTASANLAKDSTNTLLLLFSSLPAREIKQPLALLRETYPLAIVMGCSTAGEILQERFIEPGIVAAAIEFEHSTLALHNCKLTHSSNSFAVGTQLGKALKSSPQLKTVFVLSEGIVINGSQLVHGFNTALNGQIPITGGLAGDGNRFQSTWTLNNGHIDSNTVCALGIYGEKAGVSYGSKGGWDVLGPERKITHSQENILFELDGQPALSLYKKYLGDRVEGLPATALLFPLAIRNPQDDKEITVRTILGIDEENQSLTFAGDIPQGSHVQLMHANFDRLVDGAEDAAGMMHPPKDILGDMCCIAISCVGRRLILGARVEEEIEAVLDALPDGAKQIGFYSYGELSPSGAGSCDLHNQTMTLTLWWEH